MHARPLDVPALSRPVSGRLVAHGPDEATAGFDAAHAIGARVNARRPVGHGRHGLAPVAHTGACVVHGRVSRATVTKA